MVLALAIACAAPAVSLGQDSTGTIEARTRELLAPVFAASHARDSLSALADQTTGDRTIMLEEQVWQRQLEFQSALLAAAGELEKMKKQGTDLAPARKLLDESVKTGWPRYLRELERRVAVLATLIEKRNAASSSQRLVIENEISEYSDRTAQMFRDLVEAMLVIERLGVDIKPQRAFMIDKLQTVAAQTSARLAVLARTEALANATVQRLPADNAARTELDIVNATYDRAIQNLETEITLLEELGSDATALKVALIVNTGQLNVAVLQPLVIGGLLAYWQQHVLHVIATRGARWLFQALMIALILVGFALIARLVRNLVRRGVARTTFSHLLKETATSWSYRLVMAIGIVFVLKQLGVELGPMLAGLGIAGFVLGFALQDTFANFAAGGMILAYQPYDVGDVIDAGGAMGTVKKMSLVSTTILTFDNQTLIVPNKKMWGDVIRNITAQARRRVDLMFGVGYDADVAKVEQLLKEIVDADARILRDPEPLIRLHQLADSSVNFIVRVWTSQASYWDVYWDLTRAAKLRFDAEGIKIPFPQRELHVNLPSGQTSQPTGENAHTPTPSAS
jgi:small conductance mechanosensitive channel